MAVTQDGTITLRIQSLLTNTIDLNAVVYNLVKNVSILLPDGTAADQANMNFSDQRTLAASAAEDLDFAGGLSNAFGVATTFAKIKLLYIFAAIANINAVRITRPASNGVPLFIAAGDGIDIPPGGHLLFVAPGAGVTVTAATGDLLTITNGVLEHQ